MNSNICMVDPFWPSPRRCSRSSTAQKESDGFRNPTPQVCHETSVKPDHSSTPDPVKPGAVLDNTLYRSNSLASWQSVLRDPAFCAHLSTYRALCGQCTWIARTGCKQHIRLSHPETYVLHSRAASSPCRYCGRLSGISAAVFASKHKPRLIQHLPMEAEDLAGVGQREMEILELNSHSSRAAERWTRSRRSGTSGQRRSGKGSWTILRLLEWRSTKACPGWSTETMPSHRAGTTWSGLEWSSEEKGAGVQARPLQVPGHPQHPGQAGRSRSPQQCADCLSEHRRPNL